MEINVDSHFVIGGAHVKHNMPCQDHAISGCTSSSGFIVISDGCSSGGMHTDIGARILTCATREVLRDFSEKQDLEFSDPSLPNSICERIRAIAQTTQNIMGLADNDLRATLIYSIINNSGGFVNVIGDGFILLKYKDGSSVSYSFEWQNNTPYYLMYGGKDYRRFIETHKKTNDGLQSLIVKKTTTLVDGFTSVEVETYDLTTAMKGYVVPVTAEMIESGLECIVICSDGIDNFKKESDLIDQNKIIPELISFKTWKGEFVKRRLSRMLSDFNKEGIYPNDDMSCAVIHIENNLKTEQNATEETT